MNLSIKKKRNAGLKFVDQVLSANESYLIDGINKQNESVEYQIEYKVEKSPATLKLEALNKGLCEIPRWLAVVGGLLLLFLVCMFVASMVLLTNIPRDGVYMESCATRQCIKSLNLVCINKTCQCPSSQHYTYKCVDYSTYTEDCVYTTDCIQSQSLVCLYSKCVCLTSKYWSTQLKSCVDRKTYNEPCNSDQCKTNLYLTCSVSSICDCQNTVTHFWNGSMCIPKRHNGESCTATSNCVSSELTLCRNSICSCDPNLEFFHPSDLKCEPKRLELQECNFDYMCLNSLFCSAFSVCICDIYKYFNTTLLDCVDRKTYNEQCNGDQCKTNLNLICSNSTGLCDCQNTITQFWNGLKCIPKRHNGESCTATSNCVTSELTQCRNLTCSCDPLLEYFDPTDLKCEPKKTEFEACSFNSMCLNPMFCSALSVCRCSTNKYFNSTLSDCLDQKLINEPCSTTNECRIDKQLECTLGSCQCTSNRTWSTTSQSCQLTYSQTGCSSSNACNSDENLYCRSQLTTSKNCSCPQLSQVGMCDCVKESNSEFYWNGTKCIPANGYDQPCTTTYQCKSYTEFTFCNTTTGRCDCEKPGGFTSNQICGKCFPNEIYYKDICYYLSDQTIKKEKKAEDECKNLKKQNYELAVVKTTDVMKFFNSILVEGYKYWLNAENDKWYNKDPIDISICPSYEVSPKQKCIHFDTSIDCFKEVDCDLEFYYICQYSLV